MEYLAQEIVKHLPPYDKIYNVGLLGERYDIEIKVGTRYGVDGVILWLMQCYSIQLTLIVLDNEILRPWVYEKFPEFANKSEDFVFTELKQIIESKDKYFFYMFKDEVVNVRNSWPKSRIIKKSGQHRGCLISIRRQYIEDIDLELEIS